MNKMSLRNFVLSVKYLIADQIIYLENVKTRPMSRNGIS